MNGQPCKEDQVNFLHDLLIFMAGGIIGLIGFSLLASAHKADEDLKEHELRLRNANLEWEKENLERIVRNSVYTGVNRQEKGESTCQQF